MHKFRIRINKPCIDNRAVNAVRTALRGPLNGNAQFTGLCQDWLERKTGTAKAFLTSSGTDALEMAALLAELKPGDEVIMPSFTFSSTANAVVLRGAAPVFIDIRQDTLNIDETLIEKAVTKRTRAIFPVHYAGIGCAMDKILQIARRHRLIVVEDAAQGVGASWRGRALGSIGDFGIYSFHTSKVLTSAEGGALLANHKRHVNRAEILWEKGTNRARLIRGEIAKYTWMDTGSSFLMSELAAALLWSQMQAAAQIIRKRLRIWNTYHKAFAKLEKAHLLRRPVVPGECRHNGHFYYLLTRNMKQQEALRDHLRREGIEACFHYVPLHSSPAGKKFGRTAGPMRVTDKVAATLLRLPLYPELGADDQALIIKSVFDFFEIHR